MIVGIFTILGILLGYYLAKSDSVKREISAKRKEFSEKIFPKKTYGEPFVINTDEYELEQEQERKRRQEGGDMSVEGVLKKINKNEG